jgi:hypothetical protein
MRTGDCTVIVYRACITTATTPIPPPKRRSKPQRVGKIRCDFDRRPRARFGTVAVRGIGWHLWIAGTLGRKYFVKAVELFAKEKDVAEAFFDQITTAAWNAPSRTGEEGVPWHERKPTCRVPIWPGWARPR